MTTLVAKIKITKKFPLVTRVVTKHKLICLYKTDEAYEKSILLIVLCLCATASISAQQLYHDDHTGEQLTKRQYIKRYGYDGVYDFSSPKQYTKDYTVSYDAKFAIIGGSIIGASVAGYFLVQKLSRTQK